VSYFNLYEKLRDAFFCIRQNPKISIDLVDSIIRIYIDHADMNDPQVVRVGSARLLAEEVALHCAKMYGVPYPLPPF
jgi:hypothetical protein